MLRQGLTPVETIFIHCSATRPSWMADKPSSAKVAEIKRWHVQERKWANIGYHYVIDRDGTIVPGRKENDAGSHVKGHNTGSIGICLIGGHGSNENDPFEKNYTPEQDASLRDLISSIKKRANIKRIRGHNDVAAKACPGFSVARWLEKKPAKKPLTESTTMQASAAQIASGAVGGVTAVSALDGNAQIVVLVLCAIVIAAGAWVMRERIRKWAKEGAS
jgi:N-acetyl-anhydromuramyl-L-alanine amidase AmpD